ncbi:hypothetical protein FW774_02220 (plasmid) [Pedobacter sp. BS3]|uniref:hypothetical protein n=1 Tax=Pedobacter sp. BS3 TaxID=2567937 RepID=UPI0011EE65BE|nr:hypothetical protein [Pedobacter sp. BS3]TZF85906.1 hypothetical protein FW774_02220 [Pedobacter sp. BS3]
MKKLFFVMALAASVSLATAQTKPATEGAKKECCKKGAKCCKSEAKCCKGEKPAADKATK